MSIGFGQSVPQGSPWFRIEQDKIRAQREAAAGERALKGWELGESKRRYELEREQEQQEWGLSRDAMTQMVSEWNRAYGQAATGEEQRYQGMLSLADQTTGQRAADIRADYTEQEATGLQRLARLGMANTTVAPTMAMGYQREQQSALNRLADQMQQTKLGIMERRDPRYPDPNLLTGVSQQLGAGGGFARAAAPLSGMRQF